MLLRNIISCYCAGVTTVQCNLAPSINKILLTIVTLSPAAWQPGLSSTLLHSIATINGVRLAISFDKFRLRNNCL